MTKTSEPKTSARSAAEEALLDAAERLLDVVGHAVAEAGVWRSGSGTRKAPQMRGFPESG